MKILLKNILPFILVFPFVFLQLNLMPLFNIDKTIPDIILVSLIYFVLVEGQIKGSVLACYYGFWLDFFSGGLIGANMFSKTIGTFIAGYFYRNDKSESFLGSFWLFGIVFIGKFIDSFFFSLLSGENIALTIFDLIYINSLFPSIYTSFFSLPIMLFFSGRKV
jgi:rod shape-determining protein MreD